MDSTGPYGGDPANLVMYVAAGLASGTSLNTTVQFGNDLPSQVIVGGNEGFSSGGSFGGKTLSWNAAESYCLSQGGLLPPNVAMAVDGGLIGTYWSRADSGSNAYWLNTVPTGLSPSGTDSKMNSYNVVCVP